MFRSPRYLEKVDYERFDLNTPLNVPGNNQHQVKAGLKLDVIYRDVIYDWYNAYFRVEYQLQALPNGALVAADTQSAPINGCFSLLKDMIMSSAGKKLYEASGLKEMLFIKSLVEYSDDFARTVAQDEF